MDLELLLPLAESIFEHWNTEDFDESSLVSVGMEVQEAIFISIDSC